MKKIDVGQGFAYIDDKAPVFATHVAVVDTSGIPTLYCYFHHLFVHGARVEDVPPIGQGDIEPVAKIALSHDALLQLKRQLAMIQVEDADQAGG